VRYLILKRRPELDQGVVLAGSDDEEYRGFPFEFRTDDLTDEQAADARRDDLVGHLA
jgi:hypothetical protein